MKEKKAKGSVSLASGERRRVGERKKEGGKRKDGNNNLFKPQAVTSPNRSHMIGCVASTPAYKPSYKPKAKEKSVHIDLRSAIKTHNLQHKNVP